MGLCQSTGNTKMQAQTFYKSINVNELNTQAKEKVRLFIKLKNCENGCHYDVSLILYDNNQRQTYKDGGHTEPKKPSNSVCTFDEMFICEYYFEKEQPMTFKIRKDNSFLADINTALGSIMGSRGQFISIKLSTGEILEVIGKSLDNNNKKISFEAELNGELKKKSYCYTIKSLGTQNQPANFILYKSEVSTSPTNSIIFNPTSIPLMLLVIDNNYENAFLSFEVFDLNSSERIGEFSSSIGGIMNKTSSFRMKNDSISLNLKSKILTEYTFLDYLRGGMQIALTIGIDFTGSNLPPLDRKSLHNITENQMNSYERAIKACGDIVAYYDYDQLFPVYGYGAIIPNQTQVNHCFPLTLQEDPNINTINGVLEQYRKVLPTLRLYGPTYFAPIIRALNNTVKENLNNGNSAEYNILMILTDGLINDMDNTIDELVEASFLPISVIIIGIGYGDFGNMDILDADDNPLFDRRGRKAARDLVQFVPFHRFQNNGEKLAEEVLEEIPRQVVEYYYKLNNRPPGDPIIPLAG